MAGVSFARRSSLGILALYVSCLPQAAMTGSSSDSSESETEAVLQENGDLPLKVEQFLLRTLRDRTRAVYMAALTDFRTKLTNLRINFKSMSEEDRDYFLCEYLVDACENGDNIGASVTLVAALQKVSPRYKYRAAWKVIEAWRSGLDIKQAPAASEEIALAFASLAVSLGQIEVGLAIVLCFYGLLRIGEALSLQTSDVFVGPDFVVLVLQLTKRGIEQRVVLKTALVRKWCLAYLSQATLKTDRFLPVSYGRVMYWLRKMSVVFGLDAIKFTSHSFRRGGATMLLDRGMGMDEILNFGRWHAISSAREYLRRGQVYLLKLRGDVSKSTWAKIHRFAQLSDVCWDVSVDT